MTEPARRWSMPWRLVLTLGLLAGGVIISTRLMPTSNEPAPWDVVGPAALTVGAAFLAMTWLQNYFWGVATALVVFLHPVYRQWIQTDLTGWRDAALAMAVLASAIASWQLAFRRDFIWRSWIALFLVSGFAVLTMARDLPLAPPSLILLWAFPLVLLGLTPSLRRGADRPHSGNLVCFVFTGFALIAVIGYLAPSIDWVDLGFRQTSGVEPAFAWERGQLDKWTWPSPWIVGPLMVWGFWCTLWRGWRERTRRRAPTPWALSLFAAVDLLGASSGALPAGALLLSLLAAFLSVFGVADIFRGLGERLILLPPDQPDRAKP
jgi:hypothetical protein